MKSKNNKAVVFFLLAFILPVKQFAQVSINNTGIPSDQSAGLEVSFPNKGVLPPRMTNAAMNTISAPADGLMIYCTDCGSSGTGAMMMFRNNAWSALNATCVVPSSLSAATSNPGQAQVVWNWNTAIGATGYKWNTVNNYAAATDMGNATSKTETGLTCNTAYTRYIWAYNNCGVSNPVTLQQSTLPCPNCGMDLIITHYFMLGVAPVNKATVYHTVSNVPGEPAKCWITSNLGADHEAISVDDATEPSAGWYWQFNRKQGYKADPGITPAFTIAYIDENSDWLSVNDPCTLELGSPWRIPTQSEWNNVRTTGNWTNWSGPWNSVLKLHAAGMIYLSVYSSGGSYLKDRGAFGNYWSGNQYGTQWAEELKFAGNYLNVEANSKQFGFSIRCIKN